MHIHIMEESEMAIVMFLGARVSERNQTQKQTNSEEEKQEVPMKFHIQLTFSSVYDP